MRQCFSRLLLWIMMVLIFIKITAADRDCDVTFSSSTTKSDKFHSPSWPKQYPNSKRCVYKFVGLSNERVKIRFNVFNIQGMSPECRYDYIDVYIQLTNANDDLLDAPMLGRFCGDNMLEDLPKLIISTHNVVIIVFYSDISKTDSGFEGVFEFTDASIYNVGTLLSPNSCRYSISSVEHKKGYIVSPTYPGTYPDDFFCTYELHGLAGDRLRGISGERIKITFEDFSIFHGGDYCPFDHVLIKDGRYSESTENIGIFCGKYENVTIFSSSENLYIEFRTRSGRVSFDENSLDNVADYKFDRRGFNISYEFSDRYIRFDLTDTPGAIHVPGTECDVRITSTGGSNGTFKSPGYPSKTPRDTTCKFYLDGEMNAGKLEKVMVKFNDFLISGSIQNCTKGFLGVIYQGHRQSTEIDEKFCGELWPPELTSRDARMILIFDTHGATKARFVGHYKFLADYAINGGKPIEEGRCSFLFQSKTAKSGTFNSPRHPDNYPSNIECVYIFRPSYRNAEKLLISFETFSLNSSLDRSKDPFCNKSDFLELYEINESGPSSDRYRPVKRFCGNYFPAPVLAHNEIKLRFRSMKNSNHFPGFKAKYEFLPKAQIQKGCGSVIRSDGRGGVIKSPRYPLKYERYTFCEWKIIASKRRNRILIQLETFMLEDKMEEDKGEGCKNAVLRIQSSKDMKEICGTFNEEKIKNEAILSSSDSETIQFLTSSKALGAKGFQLTWTEVHEADVCYGFKCKKTQYCIASDLKCDEMPNCGPGDDSDEQCPKEEKVQIVHIVIGTSISVFFCVVLLICGVYHRKKFRTRDRHSPETDQVEVRYVAATSGSNTTDRLLTLDKSEASRSPERTDPDQDRSQNEEVIKVVNDNNKKEPEQNSTKQNHNSSPQDHKDAQSSNVRHVSAPKIQKVSIV